MGNANSTLRLLLEHAQYDKGIQDAKKQLNDFTNAIGINMKKMTAAGIAIGAAAKAVSVFSETVNEAFSKGGQLAKEAEGVSLAFQKMNRPDLLDNLNKATHNTVSNLELMKAAVKFEDFKLPVEELGTMLAFAQQKAKDTGQSIDYMVESIVTGLGRKSLMILDNLGLSANEIKEKMAETGDMTKAVGEIIREQMEKAGDYVETAADRAARANKELEEKYLELGNAMKETFGISSVDDFATAIKTELVGAITFTIETINEAKLAWKGLMGMMGVSSSASQPQGYFKKGAVMPNGTYVEQTDSDGNVRGGYWNNGEIAWNSAGVEIVGTKRDKKKTPKTGGSGGGGGKKFNISSIAFNPISDESMKYDPSQHAQASGLRPENILGPSKEWENYKNVITDSIGGIADEMNNLSFDNFHESYEKVGKDIDELIKASMQQQKAMGFAAQSASNLGAALASLDDPSAKAAGQVIGAISNIALGFGMAVAQASSMGPWAWLAYVAAATAALATTISTVHSLTGFAQGGIVGGNQYSGDNIYAGNAMVNSGELVLNKAQQGNLASQLQGNGLQNMKLSGRIKGTDIILSIDRSLKLEGKQLLTWGR